jgi:hypothetical protein
MGNSRVFLIKKIFHNNSCNYNDYNNYFNYIVIFQNLNSDLKL